MTEATKCPMQGTPVGLSLKPRSNRDWWPELLDLKGLNKGPSADPWAVTSITRRNSKP